MLCNTTQRLQDCWHILTFMKEAKEFLANEENNLERAPKKQYVMKLFVRLLHQCLPYLYHLRTGSLKVKVDLLFVSWH